MVKVDKEKCIGCGSCASICSKAFEMKEYEGSLKAYFKGSGKESCIKEAIDSCPVDAIS